MASFTLLNEALKQGKKIYLLPLEKGIAINELSDTGLTFTHPYRQEPDYSGFIYGHWEEIKQLPEYQECTKLMHSDKTIGNHLNRLIGTVQSRSRITVDDCLKAMLLHITKKCEGYIFRKQVFDREYSEMEEFFYSDKLRFQAFVPLENFHCDVNKIDLGEIKIVRISKEKLEELWRSIGYFSPVPQNKLLDFRFALEAKYEATKIIRDAEHSKEKTPGQIIKDRFDNLITAMRIFKGGSVGYNFIRTMSLNWRPHGGTGIQSDMFTYPYSGQGYNLTKKEIRAFERFWKKIEQTRRPRFLDLCIKRFEFAYERERPEDKLVDYMIALEALYMGGGYKISTRMAALLGENSKECYRIFSDVRMAWEIRNKIVHGSEYNQEIKSYGKEISLGEFVSKVGEYLRLSIKEFLHLTERYPEKEIFMVLDKSIFKKRA